MFIYSIYHHNWRNISTIYIYNKTSIKRNILNIKQNTSGSRSGQGLISTPVCVCACVYIYLYIYIHTHTQTHTHHQRRSMRARTALLRSLNSFLPSGKICTDSPCRPMRHIRCVESEVQKRIMKQPTSINRQPDNHNCIFSLLLSKKFYVFRHFFGKPFSGTG